MAMLPRLLTAAGKCCRLTVCRSAGGISKFPQRSPRFYCTATEEQAEPVLVSQEDGVRHVVLNNEKKRNALSNEVMEKLVHALNGDTESNEDLSSVVISARGRVFSAGHDLSELRKPFSVKPHELFQLCTFLMLTIRELPVPVIAQVRGLATAAGCQLVASCDVAIASENSKFATPGVNIGLFCSTPAVAVCRAVPTKQAMHMLLTGEPITAQQALQYGLVSKVVADSDLEDATKSLTDRIRLLSPSVLALGKKTVFSQIHLDEVKAYEVAGMAMSKNATFPDCQEGISAFLEKRRPKWGKR